VDPGPVLRLGQIRVGLGVLQQGGVGELVAELGLGPDGLQAARGVGADQAPDAVLVFQGRGPGCGGEGGEVVDGERASGSGEHTEHGQGERIGVAALEVVDLLQRERL
jgi:hypothetical protein